MKNDPFAQQREAQRRSEQMRQGMQREQKLVSDQMRRGQQELQGITSRSGQLKRGKAGSLEAEQARLAAARRAWLESDEGRAARAADLADDWQDEEDPRGGRRSPGVQAQGPSADAPPTSAPGGSYDRGRGRAFGGVVWGGGQDTGSSGRVMGQSRSTNRATAGPKPKWRGSVVGQARDVTAQGGQDVLLTFRLERYDASSIRQRPVSVRLKGDRTIGLISEGDWVEVVGKMNRGVLMGRKAFNHSTESDFKHSHKRQIAMIAAVVIFACWFGFLGLLVAGNGKLPAWFPELGAFGQQIGLTNTDALSKIHYDACVKSGAPVEVCTQLYGSH